MRIKLSLALLFMALASCGKTETVTAPSAPVPTVGRTPAPSAPVNDVVLTSADPPQNTTISLAERQKVTFSVNVTIGVPAGLKVRAFLTAHPTPSETDCETQVDSGPYFGPITNQAQTIVLNIRQLLQDCPQLPQPVSLTLLLHDDRESYVLKQTAAFYTLAP
jgi:hypothetical protein